jgi:hypothetical protein
MERETRHMKIEQTKSTNMVKFRDLKSGDCFTYESKKYIACAGNVVSDAGEVNAAVDLKTGEYKYLRDLNPTVEFHPNARVVID